MLVAAPRPARLWAGGATPWAGQAPRGGGVGPPHAGVPSGLSASLGRGADRNSQGGTESRGGAGTRGAVGEAWGSSKTTSSSRSVFGALSVCLSLPVCLSIFVSVLITHHLCLSLCASLSPPLSLSISASSCISVSGCLSVSLSLPLSDSPLAGLEARLQWTQPGRTLKAAEAPPLSFCPAERVSSAACQLTGLQGSRAGGTPGFCAPFPWTPRSLSQAPGDSASPGRATARGPGERTDLGEGGTIWAA